MVFEPSTCGLRTHGLLNLPDLKLTPLSGLKTCLAIIIPCFWTNIGMSDFLHVRVAERGRFH